MTIVAVAITGGLTDSSEIALHISSLWPREVTVIEADPDGGRLAARKDWPPRPGLVDLAAGSRTRSGVVGEHAHSIDTRRRVVVAPPAPEAVIAAIRLLTASNSRLDEQLGTDVLLDVGRLRPESPALALLQRADRRVLVVRRDAEDVVATMHRRPLLESVGDWSILTAGGRYPIDEVRSVLQWPIAADLLPSNKREAGALRSAIIQMAHDSRRLEVLATSEVA
jgi:hypothetical protein